MKTGRQLLTDNGDWKDIPIEVLNNWVRVGLLLLEQQQLSILLRLAHSLCIVLSAAFYCRCCCCYVAYLNIWTAKLRVCFALLFPPPHSRTAVSVNYQGIAFKKTSIGIG